MFTLKVFNLNAPVPPANETDSLKQPGQYQSGYSQGFSGQTQHAVEQPDLQSEQLQSGEQGVGKERESWCDWRMLRQLARAVRGAFL